MKVAQQPTCTLTAAGRRARHGLTRGSRDSPLGSEKKDGHAVVLGNKFCSKPNHQARRGPKSPYRKQLALIKQDDGQMNIILAHNTALKAGRRLNKDGKYYDLQPWMSQIERACVQRAKEEDEERKTTARTILRKKCRQCGLTLSSVCPQT